MAREVTRKCDLCDEEAEIVGKLYFTPLIEEGTERGNGTDRGRRKSEHSAYKAHMDVGKCCAAKVVKLGKWQQRKTMPRKKRKKV